MAVNEYFVYVILVSVLRYAAPLSSEESKFIMGQVLDGLDYLHEHEWVNGNVDHHSILVLARDLLFIKLADGTLHGMTNLEKPEGYHDLHASQKIGPALDQFRRGI